MSSSHPQGQLPVTFFNAAPESSPQVFTVGAFDAPSIGVHGALLIVDMREGRLQLLKACGCHVSVSLSALLLQLAGSHCRGEAPASTAH
jgi:hypothetical protein